MALLKKITAATLMETLVATVLIVIIFTMASLLLDSIFANSIRNSTQSVRDKMQQLTYQYKNRLVSLPHTEEWNSYEISMNRITIKGITYVMLEATDKKWNKKVTTYAKDED